MSIVTTRSRPHSRTIADLAIVALVALIFAACSSQPDRLWIRSPGWSRAQLVAETRVPDPVPLAIGPEGTLYFLTFATTESGNFPRAIAMSREGEILWDNTYTDVAIEGPHQPELLWTGRGLQALWISGEEMHSATIDGFGQMVGPRVLWSETPVASIDALVDGHGRAQVWFSGPPKEPGLYCLAGINSVPTLVDDEGVGPNIRLDDAGVVHALWSRESPEPGTVPIVYGTVPEGSCVPGIEQIVATQLTGASTTFTGPTLGLDPDNVYAFWSTVSYSGLEPGREETKFVNFPKGNPTSTSGDLSVQVPYSFTLDYEYLDGSLDSGPRVPLASAPELSGSQIADVISNKSPADELAVVILGHLEYPMRTSKPQISALYLKDGSAGSYQQLSFTPTQSTAPMLMSGTDNELYLTWLERSPDRGWGVYFSSTAADLKEALSGLDSADVGRLTLESAFGLATGALLLPVGFVWALPALLALVLTSPLRRADDSLGNLGTLISLVVALGVLWAVKFAVLPSIQDYVPFSAWIPVVPIWLREPLRIGVPTLIAAVSAVVALWIISRRHDDSPYNFLVIYLLLDGLLTMSIYGVFIYGAV